MHLSKKAQIAYLKANKVFTKVSSKYTNFIDGFLPKLAIELPTYMRINDHIIKLVDNQQPQYSPIYSLDSIELETLKTYIENNLANGFIRLFKFYTMVFIFFDKKLDESLRLYINY